jgi:type III pantothenate kinase
VTNLLIDAGNTNIKLATDEPDSSVASMPTRRAFELGFEQYDGIEQVWASNVAGVEVAQQIVRACAERGLALRFIEAKSEQCGVRNGYEVPAQLGSDRWAALIAAWHHSRAACLVVNCGTATTIDALSGSGEFLGGLILPGVHLMQDSLYRATALPRQGKSIYADFPRNTADAIYSGAIKAICAAIFQQHELLGASSGMLLSGGAARLLLPHLALRAEMMDNLVLQGLRLIARDSDRV